MIYGTHPTDTKTTAKTKHDYLKEAFWEKRYEIELDHKIQVNNKNNALATTRLSPTSTAIEGDNSLRYLVKSVWSTGDPPSVLSCCSPLRSTCLNWIIDDEPKRISQRTVLFGSRKPLRNPSPLAPSLESPTKYRKYLSD